MGHLDPLRPKGGAAVNTSTQLRRRWCEAVLEGRYATADFLAAHLPEPDLTDFVAVPEEHRDEWATAGEIDAR